VYHTLPISAGEIPALSPRPLLSQPTRASIRGVGEVKAPIQISSHSIRIERQYIASLCVLCVWACSHECVLCVLWNLMTHTESSTLQEAFNYHWELTIHTISKKMQKLLTAKRMILARNWIPFHSSLKIFVCMYCITAVLNHWMGLVCRDR